MANCFGDVVDNYLLDTMVRYVGKKKTQEDRAREASNLINDDAKNEKAWRYVDGVKQWYGNGVTTLCMICNATGDTLRYVTDNDWWGYIGRTPYPTEIGNGQWAAFLHVKKTSASSGSQAGLVYRGKDSRGRERDFLVCWSTPWSSLYRNKAYCEIGNVGTFPSRWDALYNRVNNADYTWTANETGRCSIEASTARGTSPLFTAKIITPYSP